LLAPMSEVAGKLAPQVGAWTLQKANGGRGVLMGGVPGVGPARIVVIGGGVVGLSVARRLAGDSLRVLLLEREALGREASWAGVRSPAHHRPPRSLPGRRTQAAGPRHPAAPRTPTAKK